MAALGANTTWRSATLTSSTVNLPCVHDFLWVNRKGKARHPLGLDLEHEVEVGGPDEDFGLFHAAAFDNAP